MKQRDMTGINLVALNSATKYPSIPTYHHMENGVLQDRKTVAFPAGETVSFTEKVDGTGVRVIRLPGNDYIIASREHLLHAKGDRVYNAFEGVVEHLAPVADQLKPQDDDTYIHVYFFEVYGGRIGAQSKQYSGRGAIGHRLFDIAFVPMKVIDEMGVPEIAHWRDNGGQRFATESTLQRFADAEKIPLVPRLATAPASDLPTALDVTQEWLRVLLPCTTVALDDGGGAKGEGVVLRTHDRRVIAKARFADYERALNPQPRKGRR